MMTEFGLILWKIFTKSQPIPLFVPVMNTVNLSSIQISFYMPFDLFYLKTKFIK